MRISSDFARALLSEVERRMFDESQPRILWCLSALREEQVWRRANERSNSVGNLVLHLCGNIRQWMIHGLGGAEDERRREEEFAERGPIPTERLIEQFNQTMDEARAVLDRLDPALLLTERRVQGFDETGLSILIHVVEHLSYHTGQIAYITKASEDTDLGFYDGRDLNVTG